MSEYPAGSPRLPSLEDLDHTGTLFEDLPRTPQADGALGKRAVRQAVKIVAHPHTTTELKARHHLQEGHDEERQDAYRELGGNPTDYDSLPLFDQLAEDFEPWMTDIDMAINRLGLHELASDTIARMTKADQRLLAMHVDALLERMEAALRLIGASAGDVSLYSFLEKRYGAKRTPEEMLNYMPLLKRLHKAIHEQHIIGALHTAAPDVFAGSRQQRNERYNRYLRSHTGPIAVGYDDNAKPRVEKPPRRK